VTLSIDALHGPLVPVSLRPEPTRATLLRQANRDVPPQLQGWALIDTGARQTCVDHHAAEELYQQVGVAEAYTPSTPDDRPHEAPVYYGFVVFPGTALAPLEQTVLGMRLGYEVQGRTVLALLGRDFLAGMRMVYDGPAGKVDLTW
jgi:hypothetical protein